MSKRVLETDTYKLTCNHNIVRPTFDDIESPLTRKPRDIVSTATYALNGEPVSNAVATCITGLLIARHKPTLWQRVKAWFKGR